MRCLRVRRWSLPVLVCLALPVLGADPPPPAPVPYSAVSTLGPPPPPLPAGGPGVVAPTELATPAASTGSFVAGAGLYLVEPVFGSNRAFTRVLVPDVGPMTVQNTDFDYHLAAAPRVWLGYAAADGWGGRVRFWHYDESARASATLAGDSLPGSALLSAAPLGLSIFSPTMVLQPGNADVLQADTNLTLNVIDLEATREIRGAWGSLVLAGGARIARVAQSYNADLFNTANNLNDLAETLRLRSGQRFMGAGPTVAVEGTYPLSDSGFSLYGNVRGSVLFGSYHHSADTQAEITIAGDTVTAPLISASAARDAAVPVGEIELGVQWSRDLGGIRPFVQAGVVAQTWLDVLNNHNATTTIGTSSDLNGSLSFFGLTVNGGFAF